MRNNEVAKAAEYVQAVWGKAPEALLTLGSGMGNLAELVNVEAVIRYADVPGMPCTTMAAHAGNFVCGALAGTRVMCMQGRLHGYEGHSAADVAFPIDVAGALGAKRFLFTNASGAINASYHVGDFVAISDHINFLGDNPLSGNIAEGRAARYCDMTHAYTPALRELAQRVAAEQGEHLAEGVYIGVPGPSFETPAEIRAFRTWGADLVGMSSVWEVIAAVACRMEVLGIALVSNMAAGMQSDALTAAEIFDTAAQREAALGRLIEGIVAAW